MEETGKAEKTVKVNRVAIYGAALIVILLIIVAVIGTVMKSNATYSYEYDEMIDRSTDEVIDSGTWDYNSYDYTEVEDAEINWSVSRDGVLTISGSGDMPDLNDFGRLAPWYQYAQRGIQNDGDDGDDVIITSIVIEEGITGIGDYDFAFYTELESVSLPSTLTSIGTCAFTTCTSLTSVDIPSSVTSIGRNAFSNCSALESVTCPKSAEIDQGGTNITEVFPEGASVNYTD